MATWWLLNSVQVGYNRYVAGTLIDDAREPTAPIAAAGGRLIDSTYAGAPELALAALQITEHALKDDRTTTLMVAAAAKAAIENGGGGGGGGWTALTVVAPAGDYTVVSPTDLAKVVMVDNTVPRDVPLPAGPANGFFFWLKLLAGTAPGAAAVTLVPQAGQSIEGGADGVSRVIDNGTGFQMIFAFGGDWYLGPVNQNLVIA